MNIFYLPIEELPMRYSIQWRDFFKKGIRSFCKLNEINPLFTKPIVKEIDPFSISLEITNGQFLDYINTHSYKFNQLKEIIELFAAKKIKDGDVIFFDDIWFPGIESLAYIRNFSGIKFKIVGCLHDGTYDPVDPTAQVGMSAWGSHFEYMLGQVVDLFFVATQHSKNLLLNFRPNFPANKVKVTGFPISNPMPFEYLSPFEDRQNNIIFPHRHSPEKHPLEDCAKTKALGESLQSVLNDNYNFISTQRLKLSKSDYFDLLNNSKFIVSWNDLENWGIGMIEGCLCGAVPIVPDRLSYTELYLPEFIYRTHSSGKRSNVMDYTSEEKAREVLQENYFYNDVLDGVVPQIKQILNMPSEIRNSLMAQQQAKLLSIGTNAIPNMLREINNLLQDIRQ